MNLKKSIVLVGMMGCGKSHTGKQLAQKLKTDFIDTDITIEEEIGMPIIDIFDIQGEEYFRSLEYKVIQKILDEKSVILAVGGGAFVQNNTRAIIKQKAISIWLDVDVETILERLQYDKSRPLLQGVNKRKKLLKLMKKRNQLYGLADIKVKVDDKKNIIDSIIQKLREEAFFD